MVAVYSKMFELFRLGIFNEDASKRIFVEISTGLILVNTKNYQTYDWYQRYIITMETDSRPNIISLYNSHLKLALTSHVCMKDFVVFTAAYI
jgi:hypothetical protein